MIQLDLLCVSSAYKEKVKELPLVSLFCSCLNPRTAENPTYKAEGKKSPLHEHWCLLGVQSLIKDRQQSLWLKFDAPQTSAPLFLSV